MSKTYQTAGVHFAVNLGGPTYESTEKIVYDDTQSLFEYDPVQGEIYSQSLTYLYKDKSKASCFLIVSIIQSIQ